VPLVFLPVEPQLSHPTAGVLAVERALASAGPEQAPEPLGERVLQRHTDLLLHGMTGVTGRAQIAACHCEGQRSLRADGVALAYRDLRIAVPRQQSLLLSDIGDVGVARRHG